MTVKGLPDELYKLCNDIFLECDQFGSYERLCSFCRGHQKLYFLKLKLKRASDLQELYELNLPILVESEHEQYGWIFPTFLEALKQACPEGDARRGKLDFLSVKVKELRNQAQVCLPQKPNSEQRLFKSLLRIDFEEQEDLVKQALDSQTPYKKTAAFLVHGEEKFGQETLVTRLSQLPQLRNGRQVKIKACGMNDISNLWDEVAKYLGIANQSAALSAEQIIDAICQILQTQNLIFIIYEVNRTYLGFLPELLQEFWQLIIDKIYQKNNKETYLVMFLVDNKGYVCKSGVSLAWQLNQPEYPQIPLYLPPVSRFPQRKLQEWLGMAQAAEVVPESLCAETLLVESQGGVPELVYQRICHYCGSSWEGKLAQWLIQ
ncbi:hypothetical protein FBB35_18935 [Nostoc sp. TCL240-02]|nr:hypothetical protein FBB35_18935 [Nostoc sp. TCL240-02]